MSRPERPIPATAGIETLVEWVDTDGRRHARLCRVERQAQESLALRVTDTDATALPEAGIPVYLRLGHGSQSAAGVARVLSENGDGPLLVVTPPEAKSQRRLYRVEVDLPTQTSSGAARLINLSGGGCLLIPDNPQLPDVGAALVVKLRLPTCRVPLQLPGVVIRHFRPEFRRPRVGVEFADLPRQAEDELVRYVFLRQQELLHLGLLTQNRDLGAQG